MSEAVKEYGRALADLAAEEGLDLRLREECRFIFSVLAAEPAYIRLLAHPEVPKAERTHLIDEAFGEKLHPYMVNFMKLLTERGYAYALPDFLKEYERLYCERHDIVTAKVASAVPLSAEQQEKLTNKLISITQKQIELECTVDPSLIGGIRLQVNNTLFEGSVRAKLDSMRASLAALTL